MNLDTVLDTAAGLPKAQAEALVGTLQSKIHDKCASDGLFWLKFVKTRDEADPHEPIKPFPVHKAYCQALWADLLVPEPTVIAKSRQMVVSWALAAFCVWWARYRPHQAIYWQTKAWKDAVGMVCMPVGGFAGRCQFIEDHLPPWMRQAYKPSEGRIQYPHNGSMIQALSGGADQIRGTTPSVLVEDEFAHQEDQLGVYTAVAPLIQKHAKLIFASTPNGADNTFATLFHGRPVGTEMLSMGGGSPS